MHSQCSSTGTRLGLLSCAHCTVISGRHAVLGRGIIRVTQSGEWAGPWSAAIVVCLRWRAVPGSSNSRRRRKRRRRRPLVCLLARGNSTPDVVDG